MFNIWAKSGLLIMVLSSKLWMLEGKPFDKCIDVDDILLLSATFLIAYVQDATAPQLQYMYSPTHHR